MNLLDRKAEKIIIKKLNIFTPKINKNNSISYLYNDDFFTDNYLHFPILLNKDCTQWTQANRYLLYKLKLDEDVNPSTLDVIATDLRDFKRFCDENEVDYLVANRKVLRPNWLYRKFLHDKVNQGFLSIMTIKRKLNSIVGFYNWLIKIEKINFKFDLWTESEAYISYKDEYGFKQNKKVIKKDITSIPTSNNNALYTDKIIDGGKLRPLTQKEQIILFDALKECKNTEMTLIFLISLTTGARIQTVCTLRLEQFERIATKNEYEVRIRIGNGTNCDTKYSRQNSLFFPKWLYKKIQIYINSNKAKNKRNKAKHIFRDTNHQYVFLTNRGSPFYIAKKDPYRKLYRKPPSGETIRIFISKTLSSKLKKRNFNTNFSFHDLRATFGMNYIDQRSNFIKNKTISVTQLLTSLKERMGHSRLETTELYISFRSKHKIYTNAQDNYELYLKGLIDE